MTPSYGFTTRLMRDEYIRAGNIAPSSDVINDPRVVPCITEFINFFMDKYGKVYDFRARL